MGRHTHHRGRGDAAGGFLPKTVSAHVLADVVAVEEIARRASLSRGTVRNHLSSAVSKLGAANRDEAVHIARTHGWI